MQKYNIIKVIDDKIAELNKFREREKDLSNIVDSYIGGGVYYLRELKFQIEKMK